MSYYKSERTLGKQLIELYSDIETTYNNIAKTCLALNARRIAEEEIDDIEDDEMRTSMMTSKTKTLINPA